MCTKVYTITYYRYAHMQAMVSLSLLFFFFYNMKEGRRLQLGFLLLPGTLSGSRQADALNPGKRDPARWLPLSLFPWWLVVHRSPDQLSH